jgi:hypothetical protein
MPEAKKSTPNTDKIAYIPGDGDPHTTIWNGITFKAHIPVEVPRSKVVAVLMPIRTPVLDEFGKPQIDENGNKVMQNGILQPDGTLQTRHIEQRLPMVELAKTNPRFSVNGNKPIEVKAGTARLPQDANQYRGYSMNWMSHCTDLEQLEARWDGETALRQDCGVEQSDLAFLNPFMEMRKEQLKAA